MNQATRRSRQTAIRLFAQEYMDADLPEEGAGEYDPSFVITKLGAKVNRALVGGVIDRVERRETESGSFYTAHLRDPTGTHRFEVASFQPELHADIEEILNRFESGDRFLMLLVASRIAEAKGSRDVAFQEIGATPVSAPKAGTEDSDAIARIRAKMTEAEQIISGLR